MTTENQNALTVIPSNSEQELTHRDNSPLSVTQVKAGLAAILEVMRECMTDGKDYGKVPGCGDKPGLFQPGAQKLSMMFRLNPEVRQETITDYQSLHRGFRLIVRVTNGDKFADGVGECSTLETKYRFRNAAKKCPKCGHETIIKGKAEYGGGWLCFEKKGGCGFKWPDGSKEIENQDTGKVEHDNPPDFWNTVRKMAFKRAFVHAIINATNTSELYSQDLEDLAANGVVTQPDSAKKPAADKSKQQEQTKEKAAPKETQAAGTLTADVMFEDYKTQEGKTAAGKPWKLFVCQFATDSGSIIECGTFSADVAKNFDVLKGNEVTISYKKGRKAGTLELVSCGPMDDLPFK